MGFTNPITSIANVQTVTNSVPQLFKDLGYWPCLTGELFAPTRSGGSIYDTQIGLPVVSSPGSSTTGPASDCQWPLFSIPVGKTTCVIEADFYVGPGVTAGAGFWRPRVTVAALTVPTTTLGLIIPAQGQTPVTSFYTGPAGGGSIALPAAYNRDTWNTDYRHVKFTISPTAALIDVDGVNIVNLTGSDATAVCPSTRFSAGLRSYNPSQNAGTPPGNGYVARVSQSWL